MSREWSSRREDTACTESMDEKKTPRNAMVAASCPCMFKMKWPAPVALHSGALERVRGIEQSWKKEKRPSALLTRPNFCHGACILEHMLTHSLLLFAPNTAETRAGRQLRPPAAAGAVSTTPATDSLPAAAVACQVQHGPVVACRCSSKGCRTCHSCCLLLRVAAATAVACCCSCRVGIRSCHSCSVVCPGASAPQRPLQQI